MDNRNNRIELFEDQSYVLMEVPTGGARYSYNTQGSSDKRSEYELGFETTERLSIEDSSGSVASDLTRYNPCKSYLQ